MNDLNLRFSEIPLLAGLPSAELENLEATAKIRSFDKNTIIVSQGDESNSLYIIRSGRVRVYLDDERGRQIIINNLGTGEYFGELALLSDTVRSANVMTTEPSSMVILRKQAFMECLKSNLSVSMSVISYLVDRVQALTDDLSSLAWQDVYNRLVRFLTEHSQIIDGKQITEKVTHQEIANTVGASREMISRILSDLKTGGYISNQGKYIVVEKKLPSAW